MCESVKKCVCVGGGGGGGACVCARKPTHHHTSGRQKEMGKESKADI